MLEKIIYIVGSPRSGSSLIYNAICSQGIFNPGIPENHITPNFAKYCFQQLYRNKKIEKNYIFESEDDTKKFFKNCLEIFFKKISKKYNVNHIVLKSILLSPDIYFLHLLYPSISYVMTTRDPRDIITSMIILGEKQEELGEKNKYPRNIELLCQRINQSYRLLFEQKMKEFIKENVYLAKYEEFVIDPSKILNKIVKKFSININYKKNLNVWQRSSHIYQENINSEISSYKSYKSSLWNKPIQTKKVGIYKKYLNINEIQTINDLCGNIIKFLKY